MSTTIESSWENDRLKEEIESLRQQLAASQKREVMLRDALTESRRELDSCQKVIWLASDYGFDPAYVKGAQESIMKTDEALAATADLSGVRLCEKEPVACYNNEVDDAEDAFNWFSNTGHGDSDYPIPLYRAWEPK